MAAANWRAFCEPGELLKPWIYSRDGLVAVIGNGLMGLQSCNW